MNDPKNAIKRFPTRLHESRELAKASLPVIEVFFAVQDEARRELLQMTEAQLQDVALVCNRYPDIQLSYELAGGGKEAVPANGSVAMQVDLQRELAGDLRPVDAARCVILNCLVEQTFSTMQISHLVHIYMIPLDDSFGQFPLLGRISELL